MPYEIEVAVRKFELGAMTYHELLYAIYSFIWYNPDKVDATLTSLESLPDPLLVDLKRDVERTLNQPPGG